MSLGKDYLGLGGAMHDACMHASIQLATMIAVSNWHQHTDKSVEIFTNPNTCRDHTMKTRKGGGSGSKKALNYWRQIKALLECNKKAPATKPVNANPYAWLT